jgi:hypothetical protein
MDANPQKCILVDVDGVLSNHAWRLPLILELSPPDWAGFYERQVNDPPIKATVEIIRLLSARYVVFILTARPDKFLGATLDWLHEKQVPFLQVMMRTEGDERDADEVKYEMIEEIRRRGFEPVMAFEDHPETVRMYRALGITTFQPTNHWEQVD